MGRGGDIYDEMQAFGLELIKEWTPKGPNVVYETVPTQNEGVSGSGDLGQPWNTEPFAFVVSTRLARRCVFLADELEDRQLVRFMRNASSLVGQVNGFMEATDGFEAQVGSVIYRPIGDNQNINLDIPQNDLNLIDDLDNNERWEQFVIAAVDTLKPSRTPIINILEFKN